MGRLGMACAVNVRNIEPPLIMETANGDLAITLDGDVKLADGTIVRDWLLDKYSETIFDLIGALQRWWTTIRC